MLITFTDRIHKSIKSCVGSLLEAVKAAVGVALALTQLLNLSLILYNQLDRPSGL